MDSSLTPQHPADSSRNPPNFESDLFDNGKGPSATGHPRGLYVLFFTEMWERFSFYLMIALLALYMTESLGFKDERASDISTWYISLVYFTPFLGGLIADKITGYSRAIMIGGFLMMAGHITLAFDSQASTSHVFLFASLALLIAGNGMFKPNVSAMVGNLYTKDDPRRDQGYTIYYMGINVGATLAPLAANAIRTRAPGLFNKWFGTSFTEESGWHLAFGSAGIGMILSLLIFWLNRRKFSDQTIAEPYSKELVETPARLRSDRIISFAQTFNMVSVATALAWLLLGPMVPWPEAIAPIGLWPTNVVHFGIIWLAIEVITVVLFLQGGDATAANAAKLKAVFVIIALFWMAFHQNVVTLTYFARDCTRDSVTLPFLPPGSATRALSPELFQSVNPFCILLFSPLMVWLWSALNRRGIEPATTTKMVLGMLATALAYVVMVFAGLSGGDTGRVGPVWLIGCYVFLTVAELWISPMGLSLTSKLAPPKYRGLWMGFWFLATAVGNKLVHVTGRFWGKYPPSQLFIVLVISSCAAAIALVLILAILKRFGPKSSDS